MQRLRTLLTLALGIFLISAGIAKFNTGHVFQYIEYQSGLDIFYPYVNHLTGIAEIVAGGLLLFRQTRLVGAVIASGVLVGAVGFHLSPWLGTSIPTGLIDGASAPWTEADFATTTSSATLFLAVVTAIRALSIVRTELRNRSRVMLDAAPTIEQEMLAAGTPS